MLNTLPKLAYVCYGYVLREIFYLPIYVLLNPGRREERERDNIRLGSDVFSKANCLQAS